VLNRQWRPLAYWAAVEATARRLPNRSISAASKYVAKHMQAVMPQLPNLGHGTLRNYHLEIEEAARADPRLAALLPLALEQHIALNADAPRGQVIVCRLSLRPEVLEALRLKIAAQ
jgi:hypothetical protein